MSRSNYSDGGRMIRTYSYELWNGKKVLGYWHSIHPLRQKELVVTPISELKREYGKTYEKIKVPIATRLISNDGMDLHYRIVLDVKRKSKRQIAIIMNASNL